MKEKPKGMSAEKYEDALDAIRLKKTRGERLSKREELLFAYKDAGRCKCGVRRTSL